MVGINKGNVELFGQPAADAGFAGAHQADKHDRMISELFPDIFYLL
jgi:hypothetical protein